MYLSVYAQSPGNVEILELYQWGVSSRRPGQQQVFFLKLDGGLLHVATAGLRRREGMSGATGIRLLYCETERSGNLPPYPPKQNHGRCRHKEKHSGSDVTRLNKVHVPCRTTRAGSKNWLLVQP